MAASTRTVIQRLNRAAKAMKRIAEASPALPPNREQVRAWANLCALAAGRMQDLLGAECDPPHITDEWCPMCSTQEPF